MSVLEVKNLSLAYGERTLFRDLSFTADIGEIVGLRGKNGSGKSTLCKHIAALEQEGLTVGGEVLLSVSRRQAAIIFQESETQLFAPYVINELAFAPENLCVPRDEIKKRIDFVAGLVGITHLLNARTEQLSGGEKQLVAIGAALTLYPRLLIADEITARLDGGGREKIRKVLQVFAANGGAVLFVNHADADICNRTVEI